ncbi:hypothetical protein HK100_009270 [Physocladia obscura]|uniref:Uncharacterized protein n=1 Tax=Physocladia obscura TaxID=109957 RepID=A0AAD5X628_9FUNG|nr:hypothetical protein HK100_009270 [Physocladia obscura]
MDQERTLAVIPAHILLAAYFCVVVCITGFAQITAVICGKLAVVYTKRERNLNQAVTATTTAATESILRAPEDKLNDENNEVSKNTALIAVRAELAALTSRIVILETKQKNSALETFPVFAPQETLLSSSSSFVPPPPPPPPPPPALSSKPPLAPAINTNKPPAQQPNGKTGNGMGDVLEELRRKVLKMQEVSELKKLSDFSSTQKTESSRKQVIRSVLQPAGVNAHQSRTPKTAKHVKKQYVKQNHPRNQLLQEDSSPDDENTENDDLFRVTAPWDQEQKKKNSDGQQQQSGGVGSGGGKPPTPTSAAAQFAFMKSSKIPRTPPGMTTGIAAVAAAAAGKSGSAMSADL